VVVTIAITGDRVTNQEYNMLNTYGFSAVRDLLRATPAAKWDFGLYDLIRRAHSKIRTSNARVIRSLRRHSNYSLTYFPKSVTLDFLLKLSITESELFLTLGRVFNILFMNPLFLFCSSLPFCHVNRVS
jgi:hypothetical protein